MNTEESRKQFEAAVLTGDLLPVNSVRRNYMDYRAGGYESILTNVAWLAWQAVKAQQQWIPVSERLPENEGTYFCLGHNGTPFVCLLRNKKYEGYVWLRNTGTRRVYGITHWMPLPAPPEKNK